MCALFFMETCAYMHLGCLGVWFWILNLSQIEQVCTQKSRLFSFLRKKGGLHRALQASRPVLQFVLLQRWFCWDPV